MAMKQEFLSKLTNCGWSVTRHSENLEWRAEEIWVLTSLWQPNGFTLYLTFQTDWQPDSDEPFWAVSTSSKWPADHEVAHGEPSILFRGWPENLETMIAGLDQIRNEHRKTN